MKQIRVYNRVVVFLFLSVFFLESCSVIYKAPYYLPNDSKNWSYDDRLKSYTHPRHFMSSRMDINNGDTIITQITFEHLFSNFGSGAKAKWIGVILPIIPQISFNHKHEKVFNSEIEIDFNSTIPIDTTKLSIIFNEKYSQIPNKCEVSPPNTVKGFYYYRLYVKIQNDEILKKMKSIKINVGEPKLKWLNDIIFIRKNKSVWCMFEGAN
jgi:hypothetical protein